MTDFQKLIKMLENGDFKVDGDYAMLKSGSRLWIRGGALGMSFEEDKSSTFFTTEEKHSIANAIKCGLLKKAVC